MRLDEPSSSCPRGLDIEAAIRDRPDMGGSVLLHLSAGRAEKHWTGQERSTDRDIDISFREVIGRRPDRSRA